MGYENEKKSNNVDEKYAGQQESAADHGEDFVPKADHTEFKEMAQKTELEKTSPILAALFPDQKPTVASLQNEFGADLVPQPKVAVSDTPDEMKRCAEGIAEAKERISKMKKMKKKDRGAVLTTLGEAEGWVEDLIRYMGQKVDYSEEDVFDASIMTLMSLFGYVETYLRRSGEVLRSVKWKKGRQLLDEEAVKLQTLAGSFREYKERIPGYAQERRAVLLGMEEKPPLTMLDIVNGAKGDIKTFVINEQTEELGNQASEVFKVKKDGKAYYFKEDEMLRDFKEAASSGLPILQNEGLEHKLKEFIDGLDANDIDEAGLNIGFMKKDAEIDKGKQYSFKEFVGDLWKDIDAYINAGGRERWIRFAGCFSRAWANKVTTEGENLQIDLNANMTARNFASERVAELLGLKGLIIHNTEAYVIDGNGTQRKGFVMDQAKGIPALELIQMSAEQNYPLRFTEAAQKQLINLQILDNITGQIDRHWNNYFVEYEEEYDEGTSEMCFVVKSVVGIDNDFAFGKNKDVTAGSNTRSVLQELVHQNNVAGRRKKKKEKDEKEYVYVPGMIDRKMYQSLLTLTPELLAIHLENVIEPEYLEPLQERYKLLREEIIKAKRKADEQKVDFFREKTKNWGMDSQKEMQDRDKDNQTFLVNLLDYRRQLRRRFDAERKRKG